MICAVRGVVAIEIAQAVADDNDATLHSPATDIVIAAGRRVRDHGVAHEAGGDVDGVARPAFDSGRAQRRHDRGSPGELAGEAGVEIGKEHEGVDDVDGLGAQIARESSDRREVPAPVARERDERDGERLDLGS